MVASVSIHKKPIYILVLLYTLFFPSFLAAQDTVSVKYVIDGDTVILRSGEKVRYIGIDAPEINHENQTAEPLGFSALSYNKKLIESRRLRLEYDQEKHDHYGRQLAYVFLEGNTFVNLELLRSGLAIYLHKPPNLKYADSLLKAQQEAMSAEKGVWGAWSEKNQTYLGNAKSKRFHLPGCRYGKKIAPHNRVAFSRQWDAYWEGYSPCKKCINLK
jgi:micrococcal nuclease